MSEKEPLTLSQLSRIGSSTLKGMEFFSARGMRKVGWLRGRKEMTINSSGVELSVTQIERWRELDEQQTGS